MKILRVENIQDGYGMFWNFDQNWETRYFINNDVFVTISYRHQSFNTPQEDNLNINKDNKQWFCAYKGVDQFQNWVSSEQIKEIVSYGFRVLLLEVGEFQEGEHQVIYTKESIINSEDITQLFI
jgi:hypothetical protein